MGSSITAIGIIIPVEWDVQGNPIRVALSTDDEQEYIIDRRSGKGREIAKRLRELVRVVGILNAKGSIIVKQYEWIDYLGNENYIKLALKPKEE